MSKTFMQKENKKGEPTGPIISVALADWQRYRVEGFVFCEKTDDFDPAQAYAAQERDAAETRAEIKSENVEAAEEKTAARAAAKAGDGVEDDDEDEGISMSNSKQEILDYLAANDIEADDELTKAELLDLIE